MDDIDLLAVNTIRTTSTAGEAPKMHRPKIAVSAPADLYTARLKPGSTVVFTLYWPTADRWEGVDYELTVE
ncbi:hypothetical protein RFN29_24865 [Mesorhizobium sp. VK22B]|uniref:Uncharacterized protein n=1 Tax=Mesorhizobium captivum TaxID=3072319 RepID=A0ABU4Z695_9HYPH|nr:hypothetical protein [Mesorhizobium sp. VK22B]MDX8494800.1 hypothetical protein [Mesorhizobium sp. VK22B]